VEHKESLDRYAFWLKVKESQGEELTPQQQKAVEEYEAGKASVECMECEDCACE
jgi:hypothetical protein